MSESPKNSSLQVYIRLLGYVKPYLGYFFISIFGLAIVALSQPAFAKLLEYFVDALEGKQIGLVDQLPWLQGVTNMWLVPALMLLMALVRGIGAFAGSYYLAKMSHNIVNDIRKAMFGANGQLTNQLL